MRAEAARAPGGRVAEIDQAHVDDVDGYVPSEAIRGFWLVDSRGKLTGEYEANPHYGVPQDDFSKFTVPGQWLGWLGDDPVAVVREGIEGCLRPQVADAVVDWVKILETPRFLSAMLPVPGDQTRVALLSRMAFAAPFALSVRTAQHGRSVLQGVFSWAAVNLASPRPRRDRTWFDLGVSLDWAAERLTERIYELDDEGPSAV
ncbi:hypothetical protein [Streptomyces sp. NPDC047014]|uniref:hypothetical protein n=1 Tax=Streptomyces sp. NPDC047014 TaxID=3155736 RepID=UPI003400D1F7